MRKKVGTFILGMSMMVPGVYAQNSDVLPSWATYNEGNVIESLVTQPERAELDRSLGETVVGVTNHFTGVGYFGSGGITYYFDGVNVSGTRASSFLVNNPDTNAPDLMLREITYSNASTGLSDWRGEAVEVWAVDYNGTGEDVLLAYAYNRSAIQLADNKGITLKQVEGAKVEFSYEEGKYDHYDTLVYFPEGFKYCRAIKLVDVTEDEELRSLGGGGMNTHDGYDLDAIYGYRILDVPTEDVEYNSETAISVGDLNLSCEDSWQKSVMKVSVEDLLDGNVVGFDIIASQHYKIGVGEVYLDENDEVKVRYNFNDSYNLVKVNDVKIGIYKDYNNMIKDGKLLGNGQLGKDEIVKSDSDYAYIRLHFDVEIPTYLIDKLENIESIDTVCEITNENINKPTCDKDKDKEHKHCNNKGHKKCEKKYYDKECGKCCNKENHKINGHYNMNNYVKKTCNKVKKIIKNVFCNK